MEANPNPSEVYIVVGGEKQYLACWMVMVIRVLKQQAGDGVGKAG